MGYRIYEHIVGLSSHLDSIMEELEECLEGYTATEAEHYIKKYVPDTDKHGRKRSVYVYEF